MSSDHERATNIFSFIINSLWITEYYTNIEYIIIINISDKHLNKCSRLFLQSASSRTLQQAIVKASGPFASRKFIPGTIESQVHHDFQSRREYFVFKTLIKNSSTITYFSCIKIIKMVLNELDCSCEIRLVELVRNVPANWTKLTSFL